jgi:hypothetical protein
LLEVQLVSFSSSLCLHTGWPGMDMYVAKRRIFILALNNCAGKAEEELVPDFIFLAHCIDVLTSLHVSFCIRTLAAYPFTPHWFLWLLWLPTLICLFPFWMWAQTFVAYQYILDNLNCVTCVIPRHGFQVKI